MSDRAPATPQIGGHAAIARRPPVIATTALDVLRHGWHDAAITLAPDVPEAADLLEARLEMVVAAGGLDEAHLLAAIEDVESITARAGAPSGEALARRLRRNVYEYLLALDATPPVQTVRLQVEMAPSHVDGRMVGAEEVAALTGAANAATTGRTDGSSELGRAADASVGLIIGTLVFGLAQGGAIALLGAGI